MANRYISDLHFGHKKSLDFDFHPFESIEENDRTIVDNWNRVVDLEDDVYILGDISFYNPGKTIDILRKLNGRLHLIKGNHDDRLTRNREFQQLFEEIVSYKEMSNDDKTSGIVLSHYPIPCYRNYAYGRWVHLYGHLHQSEEYEMLKGYQMQLQEKFGNKYQVLTCRMYNVGCMLPYMNYTPRTLTEILGANERDSRWPVLECI